MKKIIFIILTLLTSSRVFSQTTPNPVGGQPITTMQWIYEPSTKRMFVYRGATLGYAIMTDSIMVKRMIANGIVIGITASNGLTKFGSDIQLGGDVNQDVNVNVTGLNTLNFTNPDGKVSLRIQPANPSITMESLAEGSGGSFAAGGTLSGAADMQFNGSSASSIFAIDNSKMELTDDINSFGLRYHDNYFTNGSINDRWIPDWGAVKSLTTAGLDGKANLIGGNSFTGNQIVNGNITTNDITVNGQLLFGLTTIKNSTEATTFDTQNREGYSFRYFGTTVFELAAPGHAADVPFARFLVPMSMTPSNISKVYGDASKYFVIAVNEGGSPNTMRQDTISPAKAASLMGVSSKPHTDSLFNSKSDTTTRYKQVWVDNNGNDATGVIGRFDRPYRTLQAAQDASLGDTVTYLRVNIGVGRFSPLVLKRGNIGFFGSAKPTVDAKMKFYGQNVGAFITLPTRLVGGTIINGPWIDTAFSNVHRYKLGIDAGRHVTDLLYGGAAKDASFYAARFKLAGGYPSQDGMHQLQTNYPQLTGIIDEDIAMLCRDSTSAVHANLKENVYDPKDINVTTYYGAYGSVYKSVHGSSVNGSGYGHATATLTLKSNDYAYGWGMIVTNYHGRNIKNFDSGGIYLISENGKSLEFPRINGFQLDSVKYGIKSNAVVDGASITDGHINVVAGKGIYFDQSWSYGEVINVHVRAAADTGLYFSQISGSYRPTKFINVDVQNGAKLGIYVAATSNSQVFFNNCTSTGNGGGGYNISGNVYTQGGASGIYVTNNTGTARTGTFLYPSFATTDFLPGLDGFGNMTKSTVTLGNVVTTTQTLPVTSTAQFNFNVNNGVVAGASAEKIHLGNGGAISTNRNVATGVIDDNTRFAYQWTHTGSTTAASDFWALQVYNTAGTQITASAFSVNGQGLFLIPTAAVGTSTLQGASTAFVQNAIAPANLATNAPVILATITGINAKTTGTTAVYTVPTGKTAVVTGFIVRCTAASAITIGPSVSVTSTTGTVYASTALTGLTTANTTFSFGNGISVSPVAADVINFVIGTAATGTSQTVEVSLIGYLR